MKAVYIRTSSDDQNPENQIADCKSMIEGEYEIYSDKQSAWKDNKEREHFERLRKDIAAKKITDVYVWDWDRIYRNRLKLKAFFEYCKIYKCKIHSYRQKFYEQLNNLQEPFNEIMESVFLDLLGWLAEDESKKKSDRIRISVRKDTGVTLSYKGNKWGRKAISEEVKQKVIDLHLQGKTLTQISSEVTYWKGSNKKNISIAKCSEIISEYKNTIISENKNEEIAK